MEWRDMFYGSEICKNYANGPYRIPILKEHPELQKELKDMILCLKDSFLSGEPYKAASSLNGYSKKRLLEELVKAEDGGIRHTEVTLLNFHHVIEQSTKNLVDFMQSMKYRPISPSELLLFAACYPNKAPITSMQEVWNVDEGVIMLTADYYSQSRDPSMEDYDMATIVFKNGISLDYNHPGMIAFVEM